MDTPSRRMAWSLSVRFFPFPLFSPSLEYPVALLASYFFNERTHLTDIYFRNSDRTQEFWTSDEVAGPKYGNQHKLYMLISHDTFSAGEGFAYEMKNLKRAVLIGAATGGGAHPGESHRLHEHFEVIVPMVARSVP